MAHHAGITIRTVFRQKRTWLIGIPILRIAVFVGRPYISLHFIEGDPPAKLTLAKVKTTRTAVTGNLSSSWHQGPDCDVYR